LAFNAKELIDIIKSGEPRIRKALNELSDDGLIETHQGEEVMYYGFIGVPCEYRLRCPVFSEVEQCLKHSFRCKVRQDRIDKEIDEETENVPDETE